MHEHHRTSVGPILPNPSLSSAVLAFQAIVDPNSSPRAVLYHEALARSWPGDGPKGLCSLGPVIAALERRGEVQQFDRSVVTAVLNAMHYCDGHNNLGCNISIKSAIIDDFWICVANKLRHERDLAHRLVIEITESGASDALDFGKTLEFTEMIKKLGCQIAFDDFGDGLTPSDLVVIAKPDIVKIDKKFLFRARESRRDRTILSKMIELCSAIAKSVVVEGVESSDDQALAAQAGARWMQGYQFHRPEILPAWLQTPCVFDHR